MIGLLHAGGLFSVKIANQGFSLEIQGRGKQVDIDPPAAPGARLLHQRPKDARSIDHGAMMIDDRGPDQARRLALLARNPGHAGQGLRDHVLARPVHIRPVRAITAGGREDKLGVQLPERLIAQTQLVHHARPEVLRHHIRRGRQLFGDLKRLRVLEVQADAALVAVGDQPQHGFPPCPFGVIAAPVTLKRALDRLYGNHIRAQVRQKLHPQRPH